jgi:hypothetical protein
LTVVGVEAVAKLSSQFTQRVVELPTWQNSSLAKPRHASPVDLTSSKYDTGHPKEPSPFVWMATSSSLRLLLGRPYGAQGVRLRGSGSKQESLSLPWRHNDFSRRVESAALNLDFSFFFSSTLEFLSRPSYSILYNR